MLGIQMGMIQAYSMGFDSILVETTNREVYYVIDFQDFIVVSEELSQVVTQFNT